VSEPGDGFTVQLPGTHGPSQYALPDSVQWRDRYGVWQEGQRPGCMTPLSHGQRITFGVVSVPPTGDAPGAGSVVVWLECPRAPIPRYPILTPQASGS
jgi:hypothetical protein